MLQLTDADSELYKNFNITISERWQTEIAETVFDVVNQDADKTEMKKKAKQKMKINLDEKGNFFTVQHKFLVLHVIYGASTMFVVIFIYITINDTDKILSH